MTDPDTGLDAWRRFYDRKGRPGETFEEFLDRLGDNWRRGMAQTEYEAGIAPEARKRWMDDDSGVPLRKAFDDGTIRFLPEFSKAEAGYTRPGSAGFDRGHDRCSDCVHYIEGGGCHIVQGDINPEAYCEEFYADYGVFAHEHPDHVEVNQELVGRAWDFGPTDIADFVDEIEERLQQRRREPEPRSGRPTRPMLIGQSLERIAESRDCERMLGNLQTTIQVMQELEEEGDMPNAESSVFRHLSDAIDQIKMQGCLTEQDAARVHNLIFDVSARAPKRGFASQMARLEEAEELVGSSQ